MSEPAACEVCNRHDKPTYYCSRCATTFCDDCWDAQIQHRPGKKTLDGGPHIKENKFMIELMHDILEPPEDAATLEFLHAEDQDTRWFGVRGSKQGEGSQFHDFRRYAQLMLDSRPLTGAPRYPKIISFIGDTNAGKSTVIKALISLGSLKPGDKSVEQHQTPVPGSTQNEGIPTSEGVHLYADPKLLQTERPILYADCEGLNAGERPPFAVEVLSKGSKAGAGKKQYRLTPRTRDIKWTKAGDPVRGTREFAVGHLYPRFLYTFSDAIVFVQKNPKQIHLTYNYLVNWAKFNIEESINQPILPHAIVVLNAVDIGSGEERWTVEGATDSFFRDVAGAVARNPVLAQLANLRYIDPRSEQASRLLLQCFYSEVHVIRVPAKRPDRYSLIDTQIRQLRRLIIDAGEKAHHAKALTRRLNDADGLQEYLQAGFDHFAANIDKPFDFRSVSLRTRVIAQDFGDHIINLASAVQDRNRIQGEVLFRGLVSLVASCILLDYVRNKLPGPIMDYFPSNYAPLCKAALHRFCEEHVPCCFTHTKWGDCRNVKSTHVKGHQNAKGKIMSGPYVSNFEAKSYESEWIESLKAKIQALEADFNKQLAHNLRASRQGRVRVSDKEVAVRLHSEALVEFFTQSSCGSQCFSNATCFGCLMAIPEVPIACGHAFCKSCATEHGDTSSDLALYLKCCPLHPQEQFDWEVPQKAEFAGVRILTLDGGGMRGIVELEILRAIESRINVNPTSRSFIPVQRLFDLIVGTSTGGIIALGLTVGRWPVDDCIANFMRLCQRAFSARELDGTIFQPLVTLHHGSKWRTSPLYDALEEAFGSDELLFGSQSSDSKKYQTKVAVVTTSQSNLRPLLATNYNREEPSDPGHSLELSDDPREAFKIWEAAAATSAAPSFFKPFECRGKTYMDGALNHNNPVYIAWREKKLIWPDVLSKQPDIFVSLGTGQHKADIDAKLKRGPTHQRKRSSPDKLPSPAHSFAKSGKRYKAWKGLKNYFSVLVSKIDNILDTEKAWDEFYGDIVAEHWSTEDSARYVRINPDLRCTPPALDETLKLSSLQEKVRQSLKSDQQLARTVEDVANRLFASSFYFKKLKLERESHAFICSGVLKSKFEGKPNYIEQVGLFLKNQVLQNFVPKVIFSRRLSTADSKHYDTMERYEYDMDMKFIDNVIARKEFDFGKEFNIEVGQREEPTYISLRLRLDDSRGKVVSRDYPISGFPRRFLVENERCATRLQKRKADIERLRSQRRAMSPGSGESSGNTSPTSGQVSGRSNSLNRRALGLGLKNIESTLEKSSSATMDDSLSDSDYDSERDVARQLTRLALAASNSA